MKNNMMTADQAYDRYFDDDFYKRAPEGLGEAHKALRNAFDAYLDAADEYEWKQGYNYALKMMEGGAV